MTMHCPKCDADISESFQSAEPDVGIGGGWYCDACDLAIGEHEGYEPTRDDVLVGLPPRAPDAPLGTLFSELSGVPGDPRNPSDPRHAGYDRFKRLAKSWGYD